MNVEIYFFSWKVFCSMYTIFKIYIYKYIIDTYLKKLCSNLKFLIFQHIKFIGLNSSMLFVINISLFLFHLKVYIIYTYAHLISYYIRQYFWNDTLKREKTTEGKKIMHLYIENALVVHWISFIRFILSRFFKLSHLTICK